MRTKLEIKRVVPAVLSVALVTSACGNAIAREREEVPQATEITVTLANTISSERDGAGSQFAAVVQFDVTDVEGRVLIPATSKVHGHITDLSEDPARLSLSFDRIDVRGEEHDLHAELISVTPREHSEMVDEGAKIGGGAAAGAVLGTIIGGGAKGAVIGAAAGAAAGTGVALATKDKHVYLPAGSRMMIRLTESFDVVLPETEPADDS